ncbi:MAG: response regulator [Candidatus Omnitrophica bacterium]|nr:response regulator [Candidatus Omnitrophota bacterium]
MADSGATVLVVDDDIDHLNIVRMKLESHQFKVITAKDGTEALRLIRESLPDIIVLDVMIPKLSGFKVARLLKFDAKVKQIPLILLTARTQEVDRTLGLEVGADAYITKPFDPEFLLKEIQRLLTSAKPG